MTDRYELTMIDAAMRSGTAFRPSVFEVFARRLPGARRYGVVAGTGRFLQRVAEFRFGDAELASLREHRVVSPELLDWLADYRFAGDIRGYAEGELYFPGSPILVVEGSFAEAVVLETVALSVLNNFQLALPATIYSVSMYVTATLFGILVLGRVAKR